MAFMSASGSRGLACFGSILTLASLLFACEGASPDYAGGSLVTMSGQSGGMTASIVGGTQSGGIGMASGGGVVIASGGVVDASIGDMDASDSGSLGGNMGGADASQASTGGAVAVDTIITINNGDFWNDTSGNRIEAHGAGLIRVGSTWYWIGEDKSHNSGNFKAVNCYASNDLSHWEFRNAIITPLTSTDLSASDRIIERPKVIYNDTTSKYVMWLHWEGQNYATAEAGVFTSDTIDGDYAEVRHFRPNGNMSRDDTLFKDDDGKAYFLSASNENADLSLYELSDDYTDIKRQVSTLWPGSYREAPAIMKANGRYFLMNSGATGWNSNQQMYATATSLEGPWSSLANVGDGTAYDTQTAFILPVQGTKATTYIYVSDRWQDPDLLASKYIWLPLTISGDNSLVLDWYATWKLNVTTGEVVTN